MTEQLTKYLKNAIDEAIKPKPAEPQQQEAPQEPQQEAE
ncbi:hypothetical protein RLON56S_02178 [Alishewanella longhuensis]